MLTDDALREIESWASECAVALSHELRPPTLFSGRSLTAEESEIAHRILRAKLQKIGVVIEAPQLG